MKKRALQVLTVLVLVLTATVMDAVIHVNDFGRTFAGGQSTCESKVTQGAELYFKANVSIMSFFAETEITPDKEYNFTKALSLVQSALGYLKEAKTNYSQAAQIGSAAGYIQAEVAMLKAFDYDKFAAEQGLNEGIKERVKCFLKNGDVIGIYQEVANRVEELTATLKVVEKNLQDNVKPQISTVWELLQKSSDLTLFGNYATVMATAAFGQQ
ncbi:MAG: hypothetical protein NT166_18680 [Candidatus Aminicenantes bacterium]|nr:hypothetical protein [Candidatus Aminicenantes bacterium]